MDYLAAMGIETWQYREDLPHKMALVFIIDEDVLPTEPRLLIESICLCFHLLPQSIRLLPYNAHTLYETALINHKIPVVYFSDKNSNELATISGETISVFPHKLTDTISSAILKKSLWLFLNNILIQDNA